MPNAAYPVQNNPFSSSKSDYAAEKKRIKLLVAKKDVLLQPFRVRRGQTRGCGCSPPPGKTVLHIHSSMYAIVEINGQQFKAEEGKKLFVNHICGAENGQTVEFEKVLLIDNNGEVKVGAPTVDGAKVVCEVLSPLVKGDKVLVFHKKRRRGYRKLNGYRHQVTELTIKNVIA